MRRLDVAPKQYSVGDFVTWQRDGSLNLKPRFQRRSMWKPGAKSLFIDTLARGLPVPLILLREQVDLQTRAIRREVVDGQQRLRTVLGFIEPSLLKDFDSSRDEFTVRRSHNRELAGRRFAAIAPADQEAILGYRFSVQVLPTDVDEREVLVIFARINSTGTKLSPQELRNAEYFGEFKTLMYELALEQLDRWLTWRVFSPDEISRMDEVEMVSDLVVQILDGLSTKTRAGLNRTYAKYDEKFAEGVEVARRFRSTMDEIARVYGDCIADSAFRQEIHFFTLFVFFYDHVYGLGSSMKVRKPKRIATSVVDGLNKASERLTSGSLPARVLNAVRGASSDIGRRRVRLEYVTRMANGPNS